MERNEINSAKRKLSTEVLALARKRPRSLGDIAAKLLEARDSEWLKESCKGVFGIRDDIDTKWEDLCAELNNRMRLSDEDVERLDVLLRGESLSEVVSVKIDPLSGSTIERGKTLSFKVTVTTEGQADKSVTFFIDGVDAGSRIRREGSSTRYKLHTDADDPIGELEITARAVGDSTKQDSVTVTVAEPVAAVIPEVTDVAGDYDEKEVTPGQKLNPKFRVVGTDLNVESRKLVYEVSDTALATVDPRGIITIAKGAAATSFTVTATSVADPELYKTIIFTIVESVASGPILMSIPSIPGEVASATSVLTVKTEYIRQYVGLFLNFKVCEDAMVRIKIQKDIDGIKDYADAQLEALNQARDKAGLSRMTIEEIYLKYADSVLSL